MIKIQRALLSVSDKTGLVDLGRTLSAAGVEIVSTGGTAKALADAGIPVRGVEELTGFPQCLSGRVKTLHPKIHAGILADRDDPRHMDEVRKLEVDLIDLVVVNLYPFEETAEKPGLTRKDLIEQIDIGGPTMLRAAAKNAEHVVVVCDPADYPAIQKGVVKGGVPRELSRTLSNKVFRRTAAYDGAITTRLNLETPPAGNALEWPRRIPVSLERVASLRYGENPHQRGAVYRPAGTAPSALTALRQLQGKELSYNNYLDMEAAYSLANAFTESTAVVVKHLNPCGVGFHDDIEKAYRRALAGDPVSAFGGIVALNRPLTRAAAAAMSEMFLEVVIAPSIEDGVQDALAKKKNLRIVQAPPSPGDALQFRSISGGFLVQSPDGEAGDTGRTCVTKRAPTEVEMQALERAWVMVRYAKSNAIVIASEDGILGLGCGQTNRVDAVKQAGERAAKTEVKPRVRVLASDAFFPFRDGLDAGAAAGVTAVIQPGGSVRDEEVIQAADEHGMAMVFTGRRSFRH